MTLKTERHYIYKDIVVNTLCNICGGSCKLGQLENHEYIEMKASWGFGSQFDGERWRAHICEKCVIKYLVPLIKFDIEGLSEATQDGRYV